MSKFGVYNLLTAICLLALIALVGASRANAQYSISRSVIGSGGVIGASGGGYSMAATVGQPVIGPVEGGGNRLHQGFWFSLDGLSSVPDPAIEVTVGGARNFPNPFASSTTIYYNLPERSNVRLEIYNAAGERVRLLVDAPQNEGQQQIVWDGRDESGQEVSAGLYVYSIGRSSSNTTIADPMRGKMLVVR